MFLNVVFFFFRSNLIAVMLCSQILFDRFYKLQLSLMEWQWVAVRFCWLSQMVEKVD